jgi:exopolysaccharide biosynthesis protein
MRKKIKISLATIFIILAAISYFLADRYLIRHVEIESVSAYSESTVTAVVPTLSLIESTIESTTAGAAAETAEVEAITYDDWNYDSNSVSISITEYSSGSGRNALTYFVADVVISNATELSNAFADDQFGTNIIEYTSQIAAENDAVFVINGDYYGFRTDGIIIRNGVIYRDVPARIGLAFYLDGTMKIYDETQTTAQELLDSGVWNTLSFGPALITDSVVGTNFESVSIDNNIGNHPIQGNQPRTGVGMIDANHFAFIVVDGRSSGYSAGMSLEEFAQMFADLGCTQAYNLDGGGSSTMYFMGRVVNNPLGKNKERGTSDILMIGS